MEFKCGSWKVMKNKIIWAVLHLQTKEKGKKISSRVEARVLTTYISLTFYRTI